MGISIVIFVGIVLVSVLIGLDIWFATDNVKGNTWSELIRVAAEKTPLIPYACGVLTGHFFHWGTKAVLGQPASIAVLIWVACVIGILGLGASRAGYTFPLWLALGIGFIGGMFLWPVAR